MNPQQPQSNPPQAPGELPPNPNAPTWNQQPVASYRQMPPAAQSPYGQNPYETQPQIPPTAPGQLPQMPIKKHKNPLVVAAIIAGVLIIIFGVLIAAMLISQSMHPVRKQQTATTQEQKSTTVLQAFTKPVDGSLVIMQGSKTISSVILPSGKTNFTTIAATDNALLALATAGPTDPNPTGYLVKADGTQTPLTASIAVAVSQSNSFAVTRGVLDQNNNFLSIMCKDTSCQLDTLNLTSGATTPIITQGYTASPGATTSLTLLGVSLSNSAYVMTYSQNNSLDKLGTLVAIDLNSGSTTKSLIMPKPAVAAPSFSPDFDWALFTQAQDNITGEIVDWKQGIVHDVTGSIGNGSHYLWSPDSKRALFFNSPHDQTSTVGTIASSNPIQTVAKTFPTSPLLRVVILGWLDNSTIEYQQISGSGPDTFNGQPETRTYNFDSGADTALPPTDNILLPISGTSITSS